jgi:hypothetical protein
MRHVKTSFFLSGLTLCIEVILGWLVLSVHDAGHYVLGGVLFTLALLEIYRIYRKVRLLLTHPSHIMLKHMSDAQQKARSYYWNIWYRFADASEHEYIAQKFHEQIRRLRK